MLLMGDEVGRSQGGNNNTWCQDNPLGWMDWDHKNWDHDLKEFVLKLISLRKQLPEFFSPDSIYDCQKDNTKSKHPIFGFSGMALKLINLTGVTGHILLDLALTKIMKAQQSGLALMLTKNQCFLTYQPQFLHGKNILIPLF